MPVTPEQLAQLRTVNMDENAVTYTYPTIPEDPDLWRDKPVPGGSWECRDYTQAKANALKTLGWPENSLTVVLLWTEPVVATYTQPGAPEEMTQEGREYHAILAAEANGAVYLLDNRFPDIYPPSAPPYDYRWWERQIPGTIEFRDISGGWA